MLNFAKIFTVTLLSHNHVGLFHNHVCEQAINQYPVDYQPVLDRLIAQCWPFQKISIYEIGREDV